MNFAASIAETQSKYFPSTPSPREDFQRRLGHYSREVGQGPVIQGDDTCLTVCVGSARFLLINPLRTTKVPKSAQEAPDWYGESHSWVVGLPWVSLLI